MRALARAALLCGLAAPLAAYEPAWDAQPGLIPPGGFILFFESKGPLSYAAPTAQDLPADAKPVGAVRGRGCQFRLALPLLSRAALMTVARGEGGYEEAVERLRRDRPALRGLYDVKVDLHVTAVLGFFVRFCAEVEALGFE